MKKLAFAILVLSIWSICTAQNTGWETGITLSGGYSINLVSNINPLSTNTANNVKSKLKPSWAYSAGVYGRRFFKNNYGFEIGLQYTSFGLLQKPNDQTGYINGKPNSIRMNYRHSYVELPLRFVFKKDLGKFGIGCFVGIGPAVLTHLYTRHIYVKNNQREVMKLNIPAEYSTQINLFADAGLLLRANISARFSLDIKPYFRITALSTYPKYMSTSFQERYMSTGFSIASVWKI